MKDEVPLDACFKLMASEKDGLVGGIGYVLAGMDEMKKKIEMIRTQINNQLGAIVEEDNKIAVASEECN